MTPEELEAIADRESLRHAAIAREAAGRGGVYDAICRKWIKWNEDGPVETPKHEAIIA